MLLKYSTWPLISIHWMWRRGREGHWNGRKDKSSENSSTYLLIWAMMVNRECNLCGNREKRGLINAFMVSKCNMLDHWLHWGWMDDGREHAVCVCKGMKLHCSGHPQGALFLCFFLCCNAMSHSLSFLLLLLPPKSIVRVPVPVCNILGHVPLRDFSPCSPNPPTARLCGLLIHSL